MPQSSTTIFVCVSCRQGDDADNRPGKGFYEALRDRLAEAPEAGIRVEPVDCLAVCKRPITVALAGAGKWLYVAGDVDPAAHLDDVIAAATSYAATENGVIPWRERPTFLRKGVISRTPPLPVE